jgi:co-chaperonin GroES (HSP10)
MVLLPLFDNILVELKEDDEKIIVEKSPNELKRGVVIAIGPGEPKQINFNLSQTAGGGSIDNRTPVDVSVGEIVYFNDRDTKIITQNNKQYRILQQTFIYAKESNG